MWAWSEANPPFCLVGVDSRTETEVYGCRRGFKAKCRADKVKMGSFYFSRLCIITSLIGGKKKPLKQPKKADKDLDDVCIPNNNSNHYYYY